MGALIGIAIQLTMLAIGLMVTLVAWMVRLTIMFRSSGRRDVVKAALMPAT